SEAESLVPRVEALLAGRSMTRLDTRLAVLRAHLALSSGDATGMRSHLEAARQQFAGSLSQAALLEFGDELEPYARELEGWPAPSRVRNAATSTMIGRVQIRREEALGSDPLTERERQILSRLREGNPNKITAFELGVSEATVKFHLRNIYRKLNARN